MRKAAVALILIMACANRPRVQTGAQPEFIRCFVLHPSPWDNGVVLLDSLTPPRALRLSATRQPTGFFSVGSEARFGPEADRFFRDLGWIRLGRDTLFIVGHWGFVDGYSLTLTVAGDSVFGTGSEFADFMPVGGRDYRSHSVWGRETDCADLPAGTSGAILP